MSLTEAVVKQCVNYVLPIIIGISNWLCLAARNGSVLTVLVFATVFLVRAVTFTTKRMKGERYFERNA